MSEIILGAIHELPENKLTQYGRIVEEIIGILPNRFNILIPIHIIMPNHIHMLVEITDTDEKRAIHESPLQRHRSVIDKMVGFLKMNTSKKMHCNCNDKIWQRSYHDHIIRDENDYEKIWNYIDTNTIKWQQDCFYPDNAGLSH